MKIYELPTSEDIVYYVACSTESAEAIFFSAGNWWKNYFYVTCFDKNGDWVTEYQVCQSDDLTFYLETEY